MTPISCEECRAQLASLTYDENPSARPKMPNENGMSPETAAHLQSCAECRREYSMLRGIAGELHSLPSFTAPPDLRARIRDQIARETANETAAKVAVAATTTVAATTASTPTPTGATPRHPLQRRSLFPRFFIPRWATYSLSGALATAFLLFVARDINPDLAPSRESRETSSLARQDTPSQSAPATRVAPAPMPKVPFASNNNALNKGTSPQSSTSRKVAPVAKSSAFSAPPSTRTEATRPTTESTTNALADNAPVAKPFSQLASDGVQNRVGRGSADNGSASSSSAPKVTAPEASSEPRLLPSLPKDATPAPRGARTTGTSSNRGASKASAPTSSKGSAAAPLKNEAASSAAAKRFARLELLPSAVPSSLQKAPPTRTEAASVRRQGLFGNAPSMSKSATGGGGGFGGGALSGGG
ncbi:MAG TPA: hypothetical protein VM821_02650, partial [Abditibacteriaceae bacterium]|nr:hypothetical protein [Abditibacteriaceae bacterium]